MHTHTSPMQTYTNTLPTQTHFILNKEDGQILYTNNSLSHVRTSQPVQQEKGFQYGQGSAIFPLQDDNLEKRRSEALLTRMEERIINIEVEIKKLSAGINKILKCIQDRQSALRKLEGLPITTIQQMKELEQSTEEYYTDVVNYFHYIGGFTLKEATNLYLREGLHDALAPSYTWFGRDEGRQSLYQV
ncbi:uncharacterized protein LOC112588817 [Harpegnathos saltator]|uniref:uncharacterized protein LOC112588817 n=1 Tax=Harpegnathos saltator TaxID=610380 RepID=UPI000DBEE8FA|nr:uncharacterized protein LOC112588817 [Harpegnathos saltator]